MEEKNLLRELREGLGLSQSMVAELVRRNGKVTLSEPHYGRIEKGLVKPNVYLAIEIATVLQIDIYEIWGG